MNLIVWRRTLAGLAVVGLGVLGVLIASPDAQAHAPSLDEQGERPLARPQRVQRKSVDQLLAILKTHQGGAQAIALAARGGARVNSGPVNVELPLTGEQANFRVTLEPGQLAVGQNKINLRSIDVNSESKYVLNRLPPQGARFYVTFKYPKNGWYIINMEGSVPAGKSVTLKVRVSVSGPSQTFQTWTYSNVSGTQPVSRSFPTVYEIRNSSNPTTLEFYLESGVVEFESITAEAL